MKDFYEPLGHPEIHSSIDRATVCRHNGKPSERRNTQYRTEMRKDSPVFADDPAKARPWQLTRKRTELKDTPSCAGRGDIWTYLRAVLYWNENPTEFQHPNGVLSACGMLPAHTRQFVLEPPRLTWRSFRHFQVCLRVTQARRSA